jgi:type IV pilus assembly protein PilN
MARINLLPWRETLRKQRQQEFAVAAGIAVAFTGVLILGVHVYMQNWIDYQQQRNNFLKQQIASVDKTLAEIEELEKTKERLLARMRIIQELQQSRPEIVHLFDELVNNTPEGVYLTKVSQVEKTVTIQGIAQSNTRVSALMRNVEATEWLENPILQVIQSQTQKGESEIQENQFILTVTVANPMIPKEERAAAEAAAAAAKEKEKEKGKPAAKGKGKK